MLIDAIPTMQGPNYYVLDLMYASNVGVEGETRCKLVDPAAAGPTALISGQSIAAAGELAVTFQTTYSAQNGLSEFGRAISAVASGAAAGTITVFGRDYLGQPMAETIALNGATPVAGKKAFKWVDRVTNTSATAGVTINIGVLNIFGIPFVARHATIANEIVDDTTPAGAGTLVAGVTTQTLTSGDPRGTYAPNAGNLPNAARDFSFVFYAGKQNGLYGAKHVIV